MDDIKRQIITILNDSKLPLDVMKLLIDDISKDISISMLQIRLNKLNQPNDEVKKEGEIQNDQQEMD